MYRHLLTSSCYARHVNSPLHRPFQTQDLREVEGEGGDMAQEPNHDTLGISPTTAEEILSGQVRNAAACAAAQIRTGCWWSAEYLNRLERDRTTDASFVKGDPAWPGHIPCFTARPGRSKPWRCLGAAIEPEMGEAAS